MSSVLKMKVVRGMAAIMKQGEMLCSRIYLKFSVKMNETVVKMVNFIS